MALSDSAEGAAAPSAPGSYAYAGRILSLMTLFGLDQPLLSVIIVRRRRLSFFGTFVVPTPCQDHSRALQVCIQSPPNFPQIGDTEPVDRGKPG